MHGVLQPNDLEQLFKERHCMGIIWSKLKMHNWWPQMRNDILSGSYNGCLVCAMHQPNKATYTLLNL